MRTLVELSSGRRYHADLREGIDISIALDFAGEQPNAFDAPRASATPFSLPGYVLDTQEGGSCNVRTISFTPHCNGTHTESIQHLAAAGPPIAAVAAKGLIGATLITVTPESGADTADTYEPAKRARDRLITRSGLDVLESVDDRSLLEAVVVRTLPNSAEKRRRDYQADPAPYVSVEGIGLLVEIGCRHLLVDVASIDRADDQGMMTIHRKWFCLPAGTSDVAPGSRVDRTVTEMIFVDDHVADGAYLLDLQVAPFVSDASPSRPILFPIIEEVS